MKGINKTTSIILLVVLIIGVICAATFGFILGKKVADKESSRDKINKKFENKNLEESKSIDTIVEASSDIEFITDIRVVSDKLKNKEFDTYTIKYNNIEVIFSSKSVAGHDEYNISNMVVKVNDNQINKDMIFGSQNLGYSNVIDAGLFSDGTNTLFVVIANLDNSDGRKSSYIIAFNQNGDVIINEENQNYFYNIGTYVENNIEVSNIISTYSISKFVINEEFANTCSDGYLDTISGISDSELAYAKTTYNYVENALNIVSEEKRTVGEDKLLKGC